MKFNSNSWDQDDDDNSGEGDDATFKLVINPAKLLHMNLVWQLVLEA